MGNMDKPKYTYLKYDDPTLMPEQAYWYAMCNGFHIGTAETEDGIKKVIEDHKKRKDLK